MKIANKISLSFLAITLIFAIVVGTIYYLTAKDSLQKAIHNNLTAVLASRSDHIEIYLKMLEVSVGQLSRSLTLEDFLKISDKEGPERNDAFLAAMKGLARTNEANPAIAEFLLMDKRGLVVASSNKSSVGHDESTDPIFLIGQKEIYVKDVYFSEAYEEPLMAVSTPIIDSVTGELSGVLAARVRLNDLNNIVANRTGMGEMGEIYIVNEYGYMITPSRSDKGAVLKQKVDSEPVKHARLHKDRAHVLPNDKPVDIYPDYRGVPSLGAHEYIPRMRWAVIAETDAKEAFRPLVMIRLIFILILFIVPAAGWLLGVSIAMLITASLRRLRKGIEMVGTGNLDYKVDTGTKDEAGQLSRAFDTMTQYLKHTTASIESLNKEIIERKKAEEELKEVQGQLFQSSKLASLGQLSAGAAHEINNPLAGITGFTEAILSDLKNQKISPDNIARDLKLVLKNAERCKVIMSNLLNFAKAKDLQRQESDINSLTDDALALVEYKTTAQNIKVVKRYQDNPHKVNIDLDQITQVFINVISNAQNAMPDGGELFVRTWSENNFELIEFKDTGIGIEKENLIKVFDPFFTTHHPGQGVGLGLSVSYSIMKRHEGSIEAKSDGKNKGASFIIKIPV